MEARTDFIGLFPFKWNKCLHCSVEPLVFYSDGHITFSFENILSDLFSNSSHSVELFHCNIITFFFLKIRGIFKSVTLWNKQIKRLQNSA
jgi:hypothetical protein